MLSRKQSFVKDIVNVSGVKLSECNSVGFLESLRSRTMADRYRDYGVDNDFDLIEAMYEYYKLGTGNLIHEPWFKKFRIQCAMNPEYTKKCLESEAFWDVRDEILERLKHV